MKLLLVRRFRTFRNQPLLTFSSSNLGLESVNEGVGFPFRHLLSYKYVEGEKTQNKQSKLSKNKEVKKKKVRKKERKQDAVVIILAAILLKVIQS